VLSEVSLMEARLSLVKPSFYNHTFQHSGRFLLFNGVSNALLSLSPGDFDKLAKYLASEGGVDIGESTDPGVRNALHDLKQKNFFVDAECDELSRLRARNNSFKNVPELAFTIAPTMDCNLGCYYCFEEHYPSRMSRETCDAIVEHVTHTIRQRNIRVVRIKWFGGEPMLHPDAIKYLSDEVIQLCAGHNVKYEASMISNGTCWPAAAEEARSFIRDCKIKHLQFTFDGLPDNHNKRRRTLDKHAPISSFDAIVASIEKVIGSVNLYLRINCDPRNYTDAYGLVDFFVQRGWLYPGSRVFPYPAQIRPHNSTCDFVHKSMLEDHTYNKFALDFLRRVAPHEEPAAIAHQAMPRALKSACGAVHPASLMIGPDGDLYRCIADFGDFSRSHGNIHSTVASSKSENLFRILPSTPQPSSPHDYLAFDTFAQTSCSACKYLPQCLSGCAKQQLETTRPGGNRANIDTFKRYWDDSLEDRVKILADALLSTRPAASSPVGDGFSGDVMDDLAAIG
jgi:uncharacterized protein